MKNKEKVKVLIAALEILKEDAEAALSKDWDKDDDGFRAQVEYINVTLALVKQ